MKCFKLIVVLGLLVVSACTLNTSMESISTVVTTPTDTTETPAPTPAPTPALTCGEAATVFTSGMNARRVIGQANFSASSANRGGSVAANTLNNPLGISVLNSKVYIGDANNSRVLIYNSLPTADGASADSVIGQANFTSNASGTTASSFNGLQGLSVDSNYLTVAEWGSRRVSFWPTSDPSQIQFSLGQPNQTSNTANNGGISQTTLSSTTNVVVAGGKYFVNDAGNHRVLIYNSSTIGQQSAASVVLGQANFGGSSSGSTSTNMNFPLGIATDGVKLIVVDSNNDRLLIFNSIPTSNGATPDVIWGGFGVSSTTLNNPVSAFYDGTKLFVADRGNDRILIFNSLPTSSSQAADVVLGHAVFTNGDHNDCLCSTAQASTLYGPHFVYYDGCQLYVSDTQNHRVVVY